MHGIYSPCMVSRGTQVREGGGGGGGGNRWLQQTYRIRLKGDKVNEEGA